MRIISEVTGKEYATVDECLAAEKAFYDAKAELESKKEENKKKLSDDVFRAKVKFGAAKKFLITAREEFEKILSDYCNQHGAFSYDANKYSDALKDAKVSIKFSDDNDNETSSIERASTDTISLKEMVNSIFNI